MPATKAAATPIARQYSKHASALCRLKTQDICPPFSANSGLPHHAYQPNRNRHLAARVSCRAPKYPCHRYHWPKPRFHGSNRAHSLHRSPALPAPIQTTCCPPPNRAADNPTISNQMPAHDHPKPLPQTAHAVHHHAAYPPLQPSKL